MANNNHNQADNTAAMEEMKAQLAAMETKLAEETARADAAEKTGADAAAKLAALEAAAQKKAEEAKVGTVRIKIPIEKNGPKEDQQVFINGRQYIIKRGVEVDVPRGVAEILANREKMMEVITAFDEKNAQN